MDLFSWMKPFKMALLSILPQFIYRWRWLLGKRKVCCKCVFRKCQWISWCERIEQLSYLMSYCILSVSSIEYLSVMCAREKEPFFFSFWLFCLSCILTSSVSFHWSFYRKSLLDGPLYWSHLSQWARNMWLDPRTNLHHTMFINESNL